MDAITNKQIKVLKVLAERGVVIASFDQYELSWLQRRGLATSLAAYVPTGKLSRSKLWAITDNGWRFLEEERAGQ